MIHQTNFLEDQSTILFSDQELDESQTKDWSTFMVLKTKIVTL